MTSKRAVWPLFVAPIVGMVIMLGVGVPAILRRFEKAGTRPATARIEPLVERGMVLNGTPVKFRCYEVWPSYPRTNVDGDATERWWFAWEDQDFDHPPVRYTTGDRNRWAAIKVNGVECRVFGAYDPGTGEFEWQPDDQQLRWAEAEKVETSD